MDGQTIGMAVAIIGGVLGIVGGAIGCYVGIRQAHGPRERAYLRKASIVGWVFILAFLLGMVAIPTWHRHLLLVAYAIILPLMIRQTNQTQMRIRAEESQQSVE